MKKARQREMDRNLQYQAEIRNLGLVDREIDCTKQPDELIKTLLKILAL